MCWNSQIIHTDQGHISEVTAWFRTSWEIIFILKESFTAQIYVPHLTHKTLRVYHLHQIYRYTWFTSIDRHHGCLSCPADSKTFLVSHFWTMLMYAFKLFALGFPVGELILIAQQKCLEALKARQKTFPLGKIYFFNKKEKNTPEGNCFQNFFIHWSTAKTKPKIKQDS